MQKVHKTMQSCAHIPTSHHRWKNTKRNTVDDADVRRTRKTIATQFACFFFFLRVPYRQIEHLIGEGACRKYVHFFAPKKKCFRLKVIVFFVVTSFAYECAWCGCCRRRTVVNGHSDLYYIYHLFLNGIINSFHLRLAH